MPRSVGGLLALFIVSLAVRTPFRVMWSDGLRLLSFPCLRRPIWKRPCYDQRQIPERLRGLLGPFRSGLRHTRNFWCVRLV